MIEKSKEIASMDEWTQAEDTKDEDDITEEEYVTDTEIDKTESITGEQEANTEKRSGERKAISIIMELVLYAVVALVCLVIIPRYVVQRTIVSGSSMESTLTTGDNLLVEKVSYHFAHPSRFDVVVFYPYGKEEKEYYVKRVIGLPGETIQIIGPNIYINGKVLEENYGKDLIDYAGIAEEPLTLEEDEYFLMGDNRDVSLDSRYEEVGPVHADLIAGRAILRIWPLNKLGEFE